jgi:sec-independent protein translocase protein TatA
MGQVGPLELVIVLIIALIVLGPQRLPEAARSVGRGVREMREALSGDDKDGEYDDRDLRKAEPDDADKDAGQPSAGVE